MATKTPTPTPRLFPGAQASDLRTIVREIRTAVLPAESWDAWEADDVHYFMSEAGFNPPEGWHFPGWTAFARMVEAEADALDPPAPRRRFYTTAEACYDGFSCREESPDAGTDDRGRPIRLVSIEERDIEWQLTRYGSGLHGCVPVEDAVKMRTFWTINEQED